MFLRTSRLFYMNKCRGFSSSLVENVKYPEVRDEYPPGSGWSGMPRKVAWRWNDSMMKERSISDIKEKIVHIHSEHEWKFGYKLTPSQKKPIHSLDYVKYATKTHFTEIPRNYLSNGVDIDCNNISKKLSLFQQYSCRNRSNYSNYYNDMLTIFVREIRNISINGDSTHSALIFSPRIESFFIRHGWKDIFLPGKNYPSNHSDQNIRIQAVCKPPILLQTRASYPEIVPLSDKLSHSKIRDFKYPPEVTSQRAEQHFPMTVPASWVGSDRCYPGLIFEQDCSHWKFLKEKFADEGPIFWDEMFKCAAAVNGFAALSASALYQGNSFLSDLQQPLVCHVVVCDSEKGICQPFVFQLNTVTLWKWNEQPNPLTLANLCFCGPVLEMWNTDVEGNVKSVNKECANILSSLLLKKPRSITPDNADIVSVLDPSEPLDTAESWHGYLNV